MGVNPVVNTDIFNSMFRQGVKLDFFTEKLGDDKTITVDFPPVLILDPDGSSRDVTLPAEDDSEGLCFFILNDGAGVEPLVVKDDGGSTILTSAFPENMFVYCDGTKWRGILSKGIT